MMTTRRSDGHLESRAMATQKRAGGADLWFVAAEGSEKLGDIEADPHVNLAYYKDRTREWSRSPVLQRSRAIATGSGSSMQRTERSGSPTRATRATGRPRIHASS